MQKTETLLSDTPSTNSAQKNTRIFSDVKSGVTALFSVRRVDVALRQKNATQGIYGRTVGAEKEEGNKAGCNLTFHMVNLCGAGFSFSAGLA